MEQIKCSDLLIHVLGYRECNQAKWFSKIVDNSEYVQGDQLNRTFTQKGLNFAINNCKKEPKDIGRLQQICEQYKIEMPLIIPKEPQTSYVYIIHCDDLPFIKCGISNNIKQRLCAYKTSHWNIITKRLYLIPDTKKLKEIEKQCFEFLVQQGCEQKVEKFKPTNIQNLDDILNKMDQFIQTIID